MKTICIIPARGGSQRIKRKNIAPFHGKPMLHYALATAINSNLFDKVIVTTDDNEVASVALKFDKRVTIFRRPKDDGTRGTQEVAREVLADYKDATVACVLYPCTPLLAWIDLLAGYKALLTSDACYSLSVDSDLVDAGGFYFGWAAAFRDNVTLDDAAKIPARHHFDINTPEDWAAAEARYAALRNTSQPGTLVLQAATMVERAILEHELVDLYSKKSAVDFWSGEFGDEYTDRNKVPWSDRVPFWRRILERTGAKSFLDVGTNAGWNLMALRGLGSDLSMTGVDINDHALEIAKERGLDVQEMPAHEIEAAFGPEACDMVITSGVLIHIPPEDLERTMKAIRNVSNRWVIAIEYEAPEEIEVEYRGHAGKLWKRPFGDLYQKLGLALVEHGPADGFMDCRFWLLERGGA